MSFDFKQFSVDDTSCAMKVGTDGVLLGAWAPCDGAQYIVDAGAGSGLIALMLAQRSDAVITAVEVEAKAAESCRLNVVRSPWATRINTVHSDVMTWCPDGPVDLLVSNPPFFTETLQSPTATRAAARHADIFGPQALVSLAIKWLADNGRLAMIVPEKETSELIWHAEINRLKVRRQCFVHPAPGRECIRRLLVFERHDGPIEHSHLTIRNSDGSYSNDFIILTNQYYIRYPKP